MLSFSILEWLQNLIKTFTEPSMTHHLEEKFTVKIVDEKAYCDRSGVQLDAHLLAQAEVSGHPLQIFLASIIHVY